MDGVNIPLFLNSLDIAAPAKDISFVNLVKALSVKSFLF